MSVRGISASALIMVYNERHEDVKTCMSCSPCCILVDRESEQMFLIPLL